MRIAWTRLLRAVVCFVFCMPVAAPAAVREDGPQAQSSKSVAQGPGPSEDRNAARHTLLSDVSFGAIDLVQTRPAAPPPPKLHRRHLGRGLLEMGAFMSYSATNYWRKYASFIEDWQFKLTWRDQRRKFFTSEGLRLDSNNFRLNWTHGAAGALYYSFGRTNGLGPAGSFLFSAGGSLFWEYGAEWREISSINDHLYTSVGGMAIAEALFHVGSHFRNRSGVANRLAGLATNPMVAINDLLDGKSRPPRVPVDTWHDFRLSTGGLSGARLPESGRAPTQRAVNLDLRVVTLPNYGGSGRGRGRYGSTVDNAFHLDLGMLGNAVEVFGMSARTTLLGWWWKDVRVDDRGLRHGHDFWLGAQIAWDLYQRAPIAPYDGHDLGMKDRWLPREQPTRYTDKLSSVHFPGPTVALTTYAGRLRTRLDLGAALNFSMVNSLPFNQYSATHDTMGAKTTLHNWGYYYALGATITGRAEAEIGAWRATAGFDYRRFRSIQGLDRYQAHVTDDGTLTDSRLWSSASLTARIPGTPLFSCVKVDHVDRRGWYREASAHAHETRVSYEIGVSF